MHLAANPHTAAQRVSTRPLSLPLLAPTHQHCSSQMDPGYEWVAYSNSDLVHLGCRGKIQEAIHCWPACKKPKTQEDKWSLPGLLPLLYAGITIDSSCCSPWFTAVYTGKKLGIWLFILYTGNEIHTQICNWRDQRMPSFLFHMYQNQAWAWGHIYKSHCLSVGQKEKRQFEVGSDRFCHWPDTALFLPLTAMPNKFFFFPQ